MWLMQFFASFEEIESFWALGKKFCLFGGVLPFNPRAFFTFHVLVCLSLWNQFFFALNIKQHLLHFIFLRKMYDLLFCYEEIYFLSLDSHLNGNEKVKNINNN